MDCFAFFCDYYPQLRVSLEQVFGFLAQRGSLRLCVFVAARYGHDGVFLCLVRGLSPVRCYVCVLALLVVWPPAFWSVVFVLCERTLHSITHLSRTLLPLPSRPPSLPCVWRRGAWSRAADYSAWRSVFSPPSGRRSRWGWRGPCCPLPPQVNNGGPRNG